MLHNKPLSLLIHCSLHTHTLLTHRNGWEEAAAHQSAPHVSRQQSCNTTAGPPPPHPTPSSSPCCHHNKAHLCPSHRCPTLPCTCGPVMMRQPFRQQQHTLRCKRGSLTPHTSLTTRGHQPNHPSKVQRHSHPCNLPSPSPQPSSGQATRPHHPHHLTPQNNKATVPHPHPHACKAPPKKETCHPYLISLTSLKTCHCSPETSEWQSSPPFPPHLIHHLVPTYPMQEHKQRQHLPPLLPCTTRW